MTVIFSAYVWQEILNGNDEDRPVLDQVRCAVAAGLIDAVIAYSPDHLSREEYRLIKMIAGIQEAGVELHFVHDTMHELPELLPRFIWSVRPRSGTGRQASWYPAYNRIGGTIPQPIATIYARVSTDQQEEGTSFDTQIAFCMAEAAEMGFLVNGEIICRETWTGTELDHPLLNELRRIVRAHGVDAVFFYTSDRLSRDPIHLIMMMREFEEAGVELHFVQVTVQSCRVIPFRGRCSGKCRHPERAGADQRE